MRHPGPEPPAPLRAVRHFSPSPGSSFFWDSPRKWSADPRILDSKALGRIIEDEYAVMREKYEAPKNPVVLCHGLLGFDELKLAGNFMPGIAYWRGISEGLTALGVDVITTAVPASGSIEVRSKALMEQIEAKAAQKSVNLIGGIDSRYMISLLKPDKFNVASLTTIATPHRGSSFADYVFEFIDSMHSLHRLPRLYKAMKNIGLETGAFSQLTTSYMQDIFNPACPDVEGVSYYSYGALAKPGLFSGTLIGPTHLDIINWTNRLKWMFMERRFNAVALYCDIADMLAKEGL
ncbi:alpha/beta-hydrolase [Terfezia boudieri ATCC MYA-4762]|uniref:Alpha/beta-hydrolase n=1 Tax=Terfezia boudieri ATCC MYA-4762 TaxID=1051890 RepID=A0A3N4LX68_9PEZI|nr:alpha/beta-hydrolase [Terfezia boudieri ATCC MYA-4762]